MPNIIFTTKTSRTKKGKEKGQQSNYLVNEILISTINEDKKETVFLSSLFVQDNENIPCLIRYLLDKTLNKI